MEHYFRLGKPRLLLAAYQTPDVEHEENWVTPVALTSVQLWLGHELASVCLRHWERYLYVCQPKSDPHDHRKVTRLGLIEAGVIIEKCPI